MESRDQDTAPLHNQLPVFWWEALRSHTIPITLPATKAGCHSSRDVFNSIITGLHACLQLSGKHRFVNLPLPITELQQAALLHRSNLSSLKAQGRPGESDTKWRLFTNPLLAFQLTVMELLLLGRLPAVCQLVPWPCSLRLCFFLHVGLLIVRVNRNCSS